MAESAKKIDPVGEQYFEPLRVAELIVDILFYVSAAFSILALFADRTSRPVLYSVVQIGFALSVVALFVGSLAIRLSPRAQKRRYEDFLAHAFATQLSHQQTTRYYNNSAKTVPLRISAQVLENCLYTKSTASRMVTVERLKMFCAGHSVRNLWRADEFPARSPSPSYCPDVDEGFPRPRLR
jgi:uncharacterized membrane protein YeiB